MGDVVAADFCILCTFMCFFGHQTEIQLPIEFVPFQISNDSIFIIFSNYKLNGKK